MNKIYSSLKIIAIATLAIVFVQCESHEQKADTAFESYKNDKTSIDMLTTMISETELTNDTMKKIPEINTELKKQVRNQTLTTEWSIYKTECENKIKENEKLIKQTTKLLKSDEKSLRRIANLEKENNDIKKEIVDYEEEMKLSLAGFKSKMNKATFDIKNQLNEISIQKQ